MSRFVDEQRAFFREADLAHFRWQTGGPYFAATEARLLDRVALPDGGRLLEVGCGQGANLVHLRRRLGPSARLFGVDFASARAHHAAEAASARCAVGDAAHLPFCDAAFDAVLIRDLLHHLPDRAAALREAHRVLAPGGRLVVVEPNRANPLIAAAAAAERAERGMLASTAARARAEVETAGFVTVEVERRQPLPLSRLLLHHRLGRPSLGARRGVARALARLETLAEHLPRSLWAYFIVTGERRAETSPRGTR